MSIVDRVIEKAGGVNALARTLGFHHTSIIDWRRAGQIPAKRALRVHQITGIPLHELRPDVFPAPQAAETA
jgi:DNA-binding transcriptional regulator YdaS (Cro superfamily)